MFFFCSKIFIDDGRCNYDCRTKEKNVYLELADKPLLTLKEFCIYLGIGQTKARELIKSKDCTFSLKIGNRWYINKRLLDKWLSKKTLKK